MSQIKKVNIFLLTMMLCGHSICLASISKEALVEANDQPQVEQKTIDVSKMQLSDLAEVIISYSKISLPTERDKQNYSIVCESFKSLFEQFSPRRKKQFSATRFTGATEEFHGEDCLKALGINIDQAVEEAEGSRRPGCLSAVVAITGLFAAAYFLRKMQSGSVQLPLPQNQHLLGYSQTSPLDQCAAGYGQQVGELFASLFQDGKLTINSAYQNCVDAFSPFSVFQSCEDFCKSTNSTTTSSLAGCVNSTVAARAYHKASCLQNFAKSVVAPVVVSLAGARCWNTPTMSCLKNAILHRCANQTSAPQS